MTEPRLTDAELDKAYWYFVNHPHGNEGVALRAINELVELRAKEIPAESLADFVGQLERGVPLDWPPEQLLLARLVTDYKTQNAALMDDFASFRQSLRSALYPFWLSNPGVEDQEVIDAVKRWVEQNAALPDIGWIEWLSPGNRAEFLIELDAWKATAEHDEFLREALVHGYENA